MKTQSRDLLNIAVTEAETTLKIIDVGLYDRLNVQINVATNALDVFKVQGRVHSSAPFIDIATVAGAFTSPTHPILSAGINGQSADLTTHPVGNGAFNMDCSGYRDIKLIAASGNAGGSVVDLYWGVREL